VILTPFVIVLVGLGFIVTSHAYNVFHKHCCAVPYSTDTFFTDIRYA